MHRLTKTINRGTKVEPIPSHSQTSFSIDRQDRLKVSSWNLPKTKNVPSIEVIQPGTEQGMQSPIQGAHELQMMSHSSENADSSMSSVSLELDRRSSILPSVSNGAGALDVPDDIKDGEFSDGSSVSSTSYSSFSANLLRAYGLPVMFPTRSTSSQAGDLLASTPRSMDSIIPPFWIRWICTGGAETTRDRQVQIAKMVLVCLLPIVTLAAISGSQLVTSINERTVATELGTMIQYSIELGRLIHTLQRERDVRAIHLMALSSSETNLFVRERYAHTINTINEMSRWYPSKSFRTKDDLKNELKRHREAAILFSNTDVYNEIRYYTEMIATFSDWLFDIIQDSPGGHLWNQLVAYHMLVQAGEDLGVERSLGAVYFTYGQFASYDILLWYYNVRHLANSNYQLSMMYSNVVEDVLNTTLLNETNIHINAMRDQIQPSFLIDAEISLDRGGQWLDNMTILMKALNEAQTGLASDILEDIDREKNNTLQKVISSIAIMLLVLMIGPIILKLIINIVAKIQSNMFMLRQSTEKLTRKREEADAILHNLVPKYIAEKLKRKEKIQAEMYGEVTIFFSDIVGFTAISAQCTPIQVISLLNDLYTAFDDRIIHYDVYKVETIGDAYMVASGIPDRNGGRHVEEICTMALDLQHTIRHVSEMKEHQLQMRIGVHTGPVVGGVVDESMPRYCLLGEAVTISAELEQNGVGGMVHISYPTYQLIQEGGYPFTVEPRGLLRLESGVSMNTYFLMEKKNLMATLPCHDCCSVQEQLQNHDIETPSSGIAISNNARGHN